MVPWGELCALIEPVYPKAGDGRPPMELERMLRIYFLQQWFNLSDPGVEEALYDSLSMRRFAGIDLGAMPVPDETTVCKFRHLLEEQSWAELFEQVNATWSARASGSARARSSMPRSSAPRPRPRTRTSDATPRCIRPRKVISGISA